MELILALLIGLVPINGIILLGLIRERESRDRFMREFIMQKLHRRTSK